MTVCECITNTWRKLLQWLVKQILQILGLQIVRGVKSLSVGGIKEENNNG
jgi:hypothetical protein